MTPEQQESLDWLAFQYVSDELSAEERRAFEDRLADEQDAREAVARSVELNCTLAAVARFEHQGKISPASVSVIQHQTRWWRRVAWLATGTAVCFALVLLYRATQPSSDREKSPIVESGSDVSADLATAWIATANDIESASADLFSQSHTAEEPTSPDEVVAADVDETDVVAPDWMMAAVTARHKMMGKD